MIVVPMQWEGRGSTSRKRWPPGWPSFNFYRRPFASSVVRYTMSSYAKPRSYELKDEKRSCSKVWAHWWTYSDWSDPSIPLFSQSNIHLAQTSCTLYLHANHSTWSLPVTLWLFFVTISRNGRPISTWIQHNLRYLLVRDTIDLSCLSSALI